MVKGLGDKSKFANPQVERLILSLCMDSYEVFLEAATQIEESDFLSAQHAEIMSLMKSLSDDGIRDFDVHTIVSRAESRGVLEDIGGFKYLSAVNDILVSSENLPVYISELLDRSYKRKLCKELETMRQEVEESVGSEERGKSFASLASEAERRVVGLSVDIAKGDDASPLGEGLRDLIDELKDRKNIVTGLETGMPLLDKYLGGLCPGALYVVAARPKVGKSTLLMNWAIDLSVKQNMPVLFLDTEMLTSEIRTRSVSSCSGVPEEFIKSGSYYDNNQHLVAVDSAIEALEAAPYYHKYTPRFDLNEIRRLAKKYKIKHNIGCLFFDYVKMNDIFLGVNETQYLGLLTSTLKDLAGELNIPVVTAAQLSKVAEGRGFISSGMVGESDRILRYCNVLMGLTQKTKEEIEEGGGRMYCGTHRLQILENRSGVNLFNGIDLLCNPHILRFRQAEMQSESSLLEQQDLEEQRGFGTYGM